MEIEITRVTSKGQVVIPQGIREEAGLREGEKLLVYDLDGTIILKRIKNIDKVKNIDMFEKTFASLWKTAATRGITRKDVAREIEHYRKKKHA
ncbi:AbrB/MazE/SpoVT family DNA-binding domain-containing protein [Candidatus Woesearchaeota archaeon]|nr:AbrB/MazE/SpoVT family DNA-binding domain-containing protein [Candidatus Woesearchaeota archaeon]